MTDLHEDFLDNETPLVPEINNPVDLRRMVQAAQVMSLIVNDKMDVEPACKQVGISRRTYTRWVEEGIFKPLITAAITPIMHTVQIKVLAETPKVIEKVMAIAQGQNNATNFDVMQAVRFLWPTIIQPTLDQFGAVFIPAEDEELSEAEKYLQNKPEWALKPGEKIKETKTVERLVSPVLDSQFVGEDDQEE